ncbi:hypothetical protein OAN12_03575 [Halioglobus sp.]|nr:hypothetical protein [Halioglobus sp.]
METIENAFGALKAYCESEGYKGWDPYDGLSSKIFQATPLKNWRLARLAWIQGFKRSPVNFRKLLRVPKEHNAKGIGLFLSGYCNLYRLARRGDSRFGDESELLERITSLADLLLTKQNTDYSGACWGYNFDWQSKAFYLPKYTPTVVVTSFVVEALLQAYEITSKKSYLEAASSSADFVINDLNRIDKPDGLFMFSYSPLDRQAVYNASLLGTKILSLVYSYNKNEVLKKFAYISALAVCNCQNEDGSFPHSDQVRQRWRDNFHTGFKLESLMIYQKCCNDDAFSKYIEAGFDYWLKHYFNQKTGRAYYYDRGMKKDLVDLHCAAQALSTIYKLDKSATYIQLVERISLWPIENMQSNEGFFDFQKKGVRVNRIPYMRWPNAWMFYGLSYWFLLKNNYDEA